MAEGRALDVVLLGATGFTGRLVADHLARRAPAELRVGLAGRSERRLAAVRASLGASAAGWPLVTADLADAASLERLAGAAPIVVSTAGPYAPAGMALVEACAAAGTDYLDLCGEVLFMRDSIDRCHDAAVASGARVVHACGFDSIPSDLGVLLLHEAARADGAGSLESTTLVVTAAKGGLSGGTLAAMKGELDAVRASPERRRIVADPYALSPRREAEPELAGERDLRGVERDERLGVWLGPFVMASINTRVVRRSNALQDHAYGRRFAYREATGYGGGRLAPLRAAAVAAGTAALLAALSHPAGRGLLDRFLPAPGEGPDAAARAAGLFRFEIHTTTSSGARYLCRVAADEDPGYAATAVMLGESALCLALDRERLPERAGVLTPAVAMGGALVDRLREAGLRFEVEREG